MASWLSYLVVFILGVVLSAWLSRKRSENGRNASPSTADWSALLSARLPLGVLVYADSGEVRFASREAENLLSDGRPLVGQNMLALLDLAKENVRQALMQGEDQVFSVEHDGEMQQFQLLRRHFGEGEETHVLLVINPLTREIARRELDALKRVIIVISHELNNSFATMSTLLQSARLIVQREWQDKNMLQVLDGLDARATHLQQFVSRYATLARLPDPSPRSASLGQLCQRVTALYPGLVVPQLKAEEAQLDEVQIEQALVNLVKNAVEAGCSPAEVELIVRDQDGVIEIGVMDRGDGFSEEALREGVLPFYTTKEHGTGIGLALCREIAERHGGSLRIKRRAGGGSAVYLALPQGTTTWGANTRRASRGALSLTHS